MPPGFAGVVAAPLVLVLAALLPSRPTALRLAWAALAAALAVVVATSGSRTALLALCAGAAFFVLGPRRWSAAAAALLVALGTIALEIAGPANGLGRSAQYRLDLWLVSVWLSLPHPLGIGFGAFVDHGVQLIGRDDLSAVRSTHNLIYQTWADLGPVGLAALLGAVAASVAAAGRPALPRWARRLYVAVLAALFTLGCAESVVTFVVGPDQATALEPLLFVALALPFARWRSGEDRPNDARVPLGGASSAQLG